MKSARPYRIGIRADAWQKVEDWRKYYNEELPRAIGHRAPITLLNYHDAASPMMKQAGKLQPPAIKLGLSAPRWTPYPPCAGSRPNLGRRSRLAYGTISISGLQAREVRRRGLK